MKYLNSEFCESKDYDDYLYLFSKKVIKHAPVGTDIAMSVLESYGFMNVKEYLLAKRVHKAVMKALDEK